MDASVTSKERRLVQWYFVMPALGQRGFIPYTLVIGAEWLFLCMLDDLVFHNRPCTSAGLPPCS